ncbi:MAG: transcription elongation factor GreA [Chloroflexota bacterium]|nr:transcription elongation factor GreA [Chloroflexota bacterium]
MRNIDDPDSTLAKAGADFLISLPQQNTEKTQGEIYKFIRWIGLRRKIRDINPLDIANYGEQITLSEARLVRSFLTYIHKKGLTSGNLAVHLRVKKASHKKTSLSPQTQQVKTSLTRQGYARLKTELVTLKEQRSQVTEEMHSAAADKDFRENAPLAAARERKAHLEGRILDLESTLKSAVILDKDQGASKIKIGDTVLLCDLSSGQQLNYSLVDRREANPTEGKISTASPIGKTLLHKEKGQTIEISAPAGTFKYRIENVQH